MAEGHGVGPEDLLPAVSRVIRAFETLGVSYLIGGSVASAIHGEPRATEDADLVAELGPAHITPLLGVLGADFYVDRECIEDAIRQHGSFNAIHLATMQKIDIFVPSGNPLDTEQMRRRSEILLDPGSGIRAFVATPEDTILQKLRWYDLGQGVSDRQWRDVLGIIKVQGERLDVAYLRNMARAAGLLGLVERAFEEAGRPRP